MLATIFRIQTLERLTWAFIEMSLFLCNSATYKIEYEVKSSTSTSILLGKLTGLVLVDDHHGLFLASMRTFVREETAQKNIQIIRIVFLTTIRKLQLAFK